MNIKNIFRPQYSLPSASIVTVILAISIFSGLNFFYEAAQKENFQTHFKDISDIEINHPPNFYYDDFGTRYSVPNVNFSESFTQTRKKTLELLSESRIQFKSVVQYATVVYDFGFFSNSKYDSQDFSDCTTILQYQELSNATGIAFTLFDSEFYSSNRFSEYFTIIEGDYPRSETDFLMEYSQAQRLNLHVGEIYNLTTRFGSYFEDPSRVKPIQVDFIDIMLKNVNISGIYVPLEHQFSIFQEKFQNSYTLQDYLANSEIIDPENKIDNPAIFGYHDFLNPNYIHPAQMLCEEIKEQPRYFDAFKPAEFRIVVKSGYLAEYPREEIDYSKLRITINQIDAEAKNLTKNRPFGTLALNVLSTNLHTVQGEIANSRLLFVILNLPVLALTLFFGLNTGSSNDTAIMREVFLLQVKGMKKKLIRKKIIRNAILSGIFVSIFGFLGGFVTFFGYLLILGNDFRNSSLAMLHPYVSTQSLWNAFLMGGSLIWLLYYPILHKIKKESFLKLRHMINSPKTEYSKIQDKLWQLSDINDIQKETSNNVSQNQKKKRRKESTQQNDSIILQFASKGKKNDFKLLTQSNIFLFMGLIPIILCGILYMSTQVQLPDSLHDLSNYLRSNNPFVQLMSITGMLCATYGFTLILFKDEPSLMLKLLNKTAYVFFKDLNKLVSLNLLEKKKWIFLTSIFGWFSALFVNLSILSQSLGQLIILSSENNISPILGNIYLGTAEFYYFSLKFLIIVSIFITVLILQNILQIHQENQYANQNIMSRGLGEKSIRKMEFFQISTVFLIGTSIGFIMGNCFGYLTNWLLYGYLWQNYPSISRFQIESPHTFDIGLYLIFIGIWLALILGLNLLSSSNRIKLVANSIKTQESLKSL